MEHVTRWEKIAVVTDREWILPAGDGLRSSIMDDCRLNAGRACGLELWVRPLPLF